MSAPGGRLRILWVLEDGAGFGPGRDLLTTEALMRRALRDGRFVQRLTTLRRIATHGATVTADAVAVESGRLAVDPIPFDGARRVPVAGFDAVFVRVDPPIGEPVRHALLQLARVEREAGVLFVNSPAAVLSRGSKLFNLEFAAHLAPGLVSADVATLVAHVEAAGGHFVAKPLDRAGGTDVVRVEAGAPELTARLAALAGRYGFLHVQRYLPEVAHLGEVRHLVFDGRILAAWRKLPAAGDHRANLDRGARTVALAADHDRTAAAALAAAVSRREPGFLFYSLDTIGTRLNELNVENTGGLPDADALYGGDHAGLLLDRLAGRLAVARGDAA
ncbi:hypothetical protein N1F89_17250 [Aquibium sp. A9E412]|uniref:hypothetical protein n=1 Tax=Aquibium sp. A9E412 TaxID=2976767 RepID=UPI0025B1C94A|nr:hypothetical protein [Aquibium sp. A9E412]MDN2567973.1 hypothetical protein [Aquibium sp. A9E412]